MTGFHGGYKGRMITKQCSGVYYMLLDLFNRHLALTAIKVRRQSMNIPWSCLFLATRLRTRFSLEEEREHHKGDEPRDVNIQVALHRCATPKD